MYRSILFVLSLFVYLSSPTLGSVRRPANRIDLSTRQTTRDLFTRPFGDNCTWVPVKEGARRDVKRKDASNVIYFMDPNFDDLITVLYLLKTAHAKLIAVYIVGNAWGSSAPGLANVRNLLYMIGNSGLSVPVLLGSYVALNDELSVSGSFFAPPLSYRFSVPTGPLGLLYYDSMLGLEGMLPTSPLLFDPYKDTATDDQSLPILLDIIDDISTDEKLEFLSTGTLTPIAKLFEDKYANRMKKILPRIDSFYIMGGSVDAPGNMFSVPSNKHAEFNIYLDPHAAQYALANMSKAGVKTVLVPLDATDDVPLTPELMDELLFHPKTPEAQLVGRFLIRQQVTWFDPSVYFATSFLWDTSAAIAMIHPKVVKMRKPTSIRVVLEDGVYGEDFAWTKRCDSKADRDSGECFKIIVIYDLFQDRVIDKLMAALQSSVNSAQRAPKCPMLM